MGTAWESYRPSRTVVKAKARRAAASTVDSTDPPALHSVDVRGT
jgi:hypothetical protein